MNNNYEYFHVDASEDLEMVYEMPKAKLPRSFKWIVALSLVLMSVLTFSLYRVKQNTEFIVEDGKAEVAAVIDEMGRLTQQNFVLDQQVQSQEAVLQSIESNFSELAKGLKQLEGGEDLFASVFGDLGKESSSPSFALPQAVELSSNEFDGTFDVLVLGTNGAHTDTIIVTSINKDSGKMTMFSIPRDLYVNGRRINEYYTYYGSDQLKRMVEAVTGLHMDKYVKVDLEGFVNLVDMLGGVDVYVDKAINDGLYPNGRGGYEPYSIEVGQYHMNGAQALKYARSRKSTSDFDRAARQQKILTSLRGKVQNLDSKLDLKQLSEMFRVGLQYTETDITLLELVSYYYDYRTYDLRTGLVISNQNYLHSLINQNGAYTLLPRTGNFEQIHSVIAEHVK